MLSQLQRRSQLRLGSDPWPRDPIRHGGAKKKRKETEEINNEFSVKLGRISLHNNYTTRPCDKRCQRQFKGIMEGVSTQSIDLGKHSEGK